MRLYGYIQTCGFERSCFDSCVYLCNKGGSRTYLLLYVDDMLIASDSLKGIQEVKDLLQAEFEMKDLREAKVMLGMQIEREMQPNKVKFHQT